MNDGRLTFAFPTVALALALASLTLGGPASAHNGQIHEAPHGGIMKAVTAADIEIALAPAGGVRIYIYDTRGGNLPASAASDISVEIERPRAKTEYVTMRPDRTGTLWTGSSRPVTDPASLIRVGTVIAGRSGMIEVLRAKFPVYAAPKKKPARAH